MAMPAMYLNTHPTHAPLRHPTITRLLGDVGSFPSYITNLAAHRIASEVPTSLLVLLAPKNLYCSYILHSISNERH